MAKSLIEVESSAQEVKFKPGDPPTSFELTVHNDSTQFATFQVDVVAAGTESVESNNKGRFGQLWYSLSPEVCAKTPPGASTNFVVVIKDSPVPGFAGSMNLTVRVFSLELRDEEVRQVVRLVLEQGTGITPVKVELPVQKFSCLARELVEVPVRVHNPGQKPADVVLNFLGIHSSWIIDGAKRRLQVLPGSMTETTFSCQPPDATQVPSQAYPFVVEARQGEIASSRAEGILEVLESGFVEFSCSPAELQIPEIKGWFPKWKLDSATYKLRFDNASNLTQQASVEVRKGEEQQKSWLQVIPDTTEMEPGETAELLLVARTRRRWLGLARKLVFEIKAVVSNPRVEIRNSTQVLKLRVLPVIPAWMQLLGLFLLLLLLWSLSWLNPANPLYGHKAAVNSVQFNGMSDQVVSASNDQSVIRWRVAGFRNPFVNPQVEVVANTGKAVRVIRYKPVDNNLVAAGLENGEIQLWDLLGGAKPVDSFFYQKDDRVLALEFSKDSRFLFSGHGSGFVNLWNVERDLSDTGNANKLIRQKPLKFAVYGLALVGKDDKNLAIAGRYNQLAVWNWAADRLYRVSYRPGSQDDYITSIATSSQKPNLLATADTHGYISVRDISKCTAKNASKNTAQDVECQVLDEWRESDDGKPVRSVALSANGCYLASAGDDGQVMLWPLTPSGTRISEFSKGKRVGRASRQLNSVDVKLVEGDILLMSGSDDSRVRLHRLNRLPELGCDKKS